MVITGGISGLDAFCRRLAALARGPVDRPAYQEATARGLAYLVAGRPAGWDWPEPVAHFQPAQDAQLARRFERWRSLLEEALASSG